jgi:hypothetical protein
MKIENAIPHIGALVAGFDARRIHWRTTIMP